MVETKDEISRLKALQKELKQLKDLLIKKDLEKMVQDSYLELTVENAIKLYNEVRLHLSLNYKTLENVY